MVAVFPTSFVLILLVAICYARKNVLFIIVDDLRPALGCYGDHNAHTPNINKLCTQSFVFRNAYAQQALCAPSRNSLLTSRRPDALRLYDFYSYWRSAVGNFTTLPQYLKSHGYVTHSVGKIFHPGISSNYTDDYPLSWSWPTYHPPSETYSNKKTCYDKATGQKQRNLICPVEIIFEPLQTLPDIEIIKEAARFLRNQNNSKPFFLAVGFHKPHIPFRFPSKFLNYHSADKFNKPAFSYIPHDMPSVAFNPYTDVRSRDDARRENISFPFGPIPHDFGVAIRQSYYASVSYIDSLIGDVLKEVNFNDTIVVLTSDHGWSLGEHAEWAKYSNFDVALRVPLMITSPDFKLTKTHEISNIVELIDLFPTIVDLVEVQAIEKCQKPNQLTCVEGNSLLPLLKYAHNDKPLNLIDKSLAFSQYPRPSAYPTKCPNSDKPKLADIRIMGYSVRGVQFRYTIWIGFNATTFKKDWQTIYGEELYDHQIDAEENLNLVSRSELIAVKLHFKSALMKKFQ